MAEKILNTRIQNRIDTLAHWLDADPILKKGEVAIATVPANDENGVSTELPSVLIKVGDGQHKFSELDFIYAKAADVHGWAKAAVKPTYTAREITGLEDFIAGKIQDTDTQYTIIKVNEYQYKLMSKKLGDESFATDVATIDIPKYDDSQVLANKAAIELLNGTDDQTGSIAKAIKVALATAAADATSKANTAEANAKTYADGHLAAAKTYAEAEADAAEAAAKSYTNEAVKALEAKDGELTEAIAKKADTTYVDEQLALKADKATTEQALESINTELAKKADTETVNAALDLKADTSYVNTELAKKAVATEVNAALDLKANKTEVDTELAKKAVATEVEAALALKADQTDLDATNEAVEKLNTNLSIWSNNILEEVARATKAEEELDGRVDTLEESIKGLSGAMHFIGVVTEDPTDYMTGEIEAKGWKVGDVVAYEGREFVVTPENDGTSFVMSELGDASRIGDIQSDVEELLENVNEISRTIPTLATKDEVANIYATKAELTKAIEDQAVVDEAQDERIEALEAKFTGEGSVDAKIEAAKQAAIDAAAADATSKANAAQAAAETTAAADATSKANQALVDAKTYADGINTALDTRIDTLEEINHNLYAEKEQVAKDIDAAKKAANTYTDTEVAKVKAVADTAVQTVSVGEGLVATRAEGSDAVNLAIDDTVTFVFNCGDAYGNPSA